MNKVRLTNGNEYEILPVGFQAGRSSNGNDMLKLILVGNDSMTFEGIEGEFSVSENVSKILRVDDSGMTEDVASGYTALKSIEKCNNCLIKTQAELLEDGTYGIKEVCGTVYAVILEKPDIWTRYEQLKETVDLMVLSELEEA